MLIRLVPISAFCRIQYMRAPGCNHGISGTPTGAVSGQATSLPFDVIQVTDVIFTPGFTISVIEPTGSERCRYGISVICCHFPPGAGL